MTEEELLEKRFAELAAKSRDKGIFLFSDFLGLAERSVLERVKRSFSDVKVTLFGGASDAERVMARFGDPEELYYEEEFPIVLLEAAPAAPKFADALTHRDLLGAVLNLGIERDVIGDILLCENVAYLFVHAKIADYLAENLTKAKHTALKVTRVDALPEGAGYRTEEVFLQVAGERLDAVIAKLFSLSREEALDLFRAGKVFVDGRECTDNAKTPKPGQTVSVRGYGRFRYRGEISLSKKGKHNITVDKYV